MPDMNRPDENVVEIEDKIRTLAQAVKEEQERTSNNSGASEIQRPRRQFEVVMHISADSIQGIQESLMAVYHEATERDNVVTGIVHGGVTHSWWIAGSHDKEATLDEYVRRVDQERIGPAYRRSLSNEGDIHND